MKRLSLWGKQLTDTQEIKSTFYSKGGQLDNVTAITPIRTGYEPKDLAYLGIMIIRDRPYLVYQVGELSTARWKVLLEINKLGKSQSALKALRDMYGNGKYIRTYEILNTFKYLYGYKSKTKKGNTNG